MLLLLLLVDLFIFLGAWVVSFGTTSLITSLVLLGLMVLHAWAIASCAQRVLRRMGGRRMNTRRIKVAEATGPVLDWLVAKTEYADRRVELHDTSPYPQVETQPGAGDRYGIGWFTFRPSTDWGQGGPIIEREKIDLDYSHSEMCWQAVWHGPHEYAERWDDTPLVAAMRCYVTSKLGPEVEVPEELFA